MYLMYDIHILRRRSVTLHKTISWVAVPEFSFTTILLLTVTIKFEKGLKYVKFVSFHHKTNRIIYNTNL